MITKLISDRIYRPCKYTFRVDVNEPWLKQYLVSDVLSTLIPKLNTYLGDSYVKQTDSWFCRNTIRIKSDDFFTKKGFKRSLGFCRYNIFLGRDIFIRKKFAIGAGGIELRLLLMHEIGHAVGLDHVAYKGDIMYPYVKPYPIGGERFTVFRFLPLYKFPWLLLNLFRRSSYTWIKTVKYYDPDNKIKSEV